MMLNTNPKMLLRIAQADAYAMAAEYVNWRQNDTDFRELCELKRYMSHPSYHKLPPGTYTDDTQMSIALSEVLIAHKDAGSATHEVFVKHWFDAFKRDPRDGYSRNFQSILEAASTSGELMATIVPNSTKNGAAMRSVPLGVISNPEIIKDVARRQARTTHDTEEGITSSVAVALMSHYALHDGRDLSDMSEWLVNHLPIFEKFRVPWSGPVKSVCVNSPYDVGLNTAWAVHTLLTTKSSLKDMMVQVLEWGGDTDSVASIAWGIASCRYQDEALPDFFERDLEKQNGSAYGTEFLVALGERLMKAYE